jgi:hypothetical protein
VACLVWLYSRYMEVMQWEIQTTTSAWTTPYFGTEASPKTSSWSTGVGGWGGPLKSQCSYTSLCLSIVLPRQIHHRKALRNLPQNVVQTWLDETPKHCCWSFLLCHELFCDEIWDDDVAWPVLQLTNYVMNRKGLIPTHHFVAVPYLRSSSSISQSSVTLGMK